MKAQKRLRPREGDLDPPEIVIDDPEITHMLEKMAEQEGTSVQQIATHLLRHALAAHYAAQEHLHRIFAAVGLNGYTLAAHYAAQEHLHRWERLSRREQQVVALLCLGYTYREIASRLIVSYETVKTHARNAFRKLELRSVHEMRRALSDCDLSGWQLDSSVQRGNSELPP
ncbi:MAG: LuxR C-terminal-related transcriptional regulator [Anaerolineales bacterium]|nr:LuxR C-terminal-related transcriptional regulator [Anaerolineales bacterium]MDW8162023.1 LuxR C-terminal-related transcriptional regulator [Anaerolineales bacterium]